MISDSFWRWGCVEQFKPLGWKTPPDAKVTIYFVRAIFENFGNFKIFEKNQQIMINAKETQCKSTQIITLHPNWPKIALQNATTFAIFNILPWSKKINHWKCYTPSIVFCSLPPLLYLQERRNVTSQCCWILRLACGPPHIYVNRFLQDHVWRHYGGLECAHGPQIVKKLSGHDIYEDSMLRWPTLALNSSSRSRTSRAKRGVLRSQIRPSRSDWVGKGNQNSRIISTCTLDRPSDAQCGYKMCVNIIIYKDFSGFPYEILLNFVGFHYRGCSGQFQASEASFGRL